jgi:hypothetical protein
MSLCLLAALPQNSELKHVKPLNKPLHALRSSLSLELKHFASLTKPQAALPGTITRARVPPLKLQQL